MRPRDTQTRSLHVPPLTATPAILSTSLPGCRRGLAAVQWDPEVQEAAWEGWGSEHPPPGGGGGRRGGGGGRGGEVTRPGWRGTGGAVGPRGTPVLVRDCGELCDALSFPSLLMLSDLRGSSLPKGRRVPSEASLIPRQAPIPPQVGVGGQLSAGLGRGPPSLGCLTGGWKRKRGCGFRVGARQ